MMRVHNHGGMCCGIKHIFCFPYSPTDKVCALPTRVVYQGAGSEMDHPGKDFYPGPRPMETGAERLKALLEYIDEKKRSHLLEVVLTKGVSDMWKEELEKHGFRQVSTFYNSNTNNTHLVVYHRVTFNGAVVKD